MYQVPGTLENETFFFDTDTGLNTSRLHVPGLYSCCVHMCGEDQCTSSE